MGDILIVDDEKDIRELISEILQDEGYETRMAGNSERAMAEIEVQPPALCILDIWLKDSKMDGIDILKAVKRQHPNIPVIIISGHGNIEIAVAAIKQGAYDFIQKPFNIDHLMVVVRRGMEAARLRRENADLRRVGVSEVTMVGGSGSFRTMKAQLDKVTKSNGRVMLTGPAGAGKDLAARYIHKSSPRSDRAFIVVSSASITPEKMEESLFGTERPGEEINEGLLEQADGGVIYFDEVVDMPLGTQSKILRVLVDQTFTRVGGSTPVKVDLRVISSTSQNLPAAIDAGRFREELFHRLNVVPLDVPSLAERREDIPLLAEHFLELCHRDEGLPLRSFSEDSIAMLQAMPWPGNVRQLKNVVERVLILGSSVGPIEPNELPEMDSGGGDGVNLVSGVIASMPLREARELFEREYLVAQINRFGGNISRTAAFVGMERSALHRKLKSLGVVTGSKSVVDA